MRNLILLAAAAALSVPASATTTIFTGTTAASDPTFGRPVSGAPATGLSAAGSAVHYETVTFEVSANGNYDFLMHGVTPNNWDTFLALYQGSFDPSAPLANGLVANDDFAGTIGQSGFTQALTAGTSYIAVVTGFGSADFGAWTLNVTGAGDAVIVNGAVPEPASWALMLGGFGMIGGALRGRRKIAVSFG